MGRPDGMAPKKKKKEEAGEEEDPVQALSEKYLADKGSWELEKQNLIDKLTLLQNEFAQLETENRELKADLERKNEKDLNMFEYLSGVVRMRDVEISDLRQESTEESHPCTQYGGNHFSDAL